VTILSRSQSSVPWQVLPWNGKDLDGWSSVIDGADVVINLAGRSVNCRYNPKNRREMMDSRVLSTRVIGQAIAAAQNPPAFWINASTATIYRRALDRPMDEFTGELGGQEANAPSAWAFSIEVAKNWEKEFFTAHTPRTRKIALRSAMTMSPDHGGIFDTLLTLIRFGLGGKAASGKQFISWIHEHDFVRAVEFLMQQQEMDGCVNVSSPCPLPNAEFMRVLRRTWGMPVGLPASQWMLEAGAFFLRTETELILKSRQVVPRRLLDAGFTFDFPDWEQAARDLVERWRAAQ
jgi:uncharacterized protein